jgi:hypothetical protein
MLQHLPRGLRPLSGAATAIAVSMVLAVTLVSVTHPVAATAATPKCHIVVSGAPWSIKAPTGALTGDRYSIHADVGLCSFARPWVVKFTNQEDNGEALKGPTGFKCASLSTATSGDKLVYAGVCGHGTGFKPPGFGWTPQLRK